MFFKLYFATVPKFLYKEVGTFAIEIVLLVLCLLKLLFIYGYLSTSLFMLSYSSYNTFLAILLLYPYYMGFIQLNYWIFLTPNDKEYIKILTEI